MLAALHSFDFFVYLYCVWYYYLCHHFICMYAFIDMQNTAQICMVILPVVALNPTWNPSYFGCELHPGVFLKVSISILTEVLFAFCLITCQNVFSWSGKVIWVKYPNISKNEKLGRGLPPWIARVVFLNSMWISSCPRIQSLEITLNTLNTHSKYPDNSKVAISVSPGCDYTDFMAAQLIAVEIIEECLE